jgi:hypothetical protein
MSGGLLGLSSAVAEMEAGRAAQVAYVVLCVVSIVAACAA